jgi:hypothetical protein
MPRAKTTEAGEATNAEQGNGSTPNKMEAMRQALDALGLKAGTSDLQEWMRSHLNVDMTPSLITNYKSAIKRKRKKNRGGRPRKVREEGAAAPAVLVVAAPVRRHSISLDDVRMVKELAERIGGEKVKELADMLGK